MKKVASIINKKVMLGGGLLAATVLCSATTAVVVATGTGSDYVNASGQIRSCRDDSSGNVRILDNDTANCSSDETKVSWSQQGGPLVHDANGQVIGNLVDSRSDNSAALGIYNPTLNRILSIFYSDGAGAYTITNPENSIYFQSDDCTGQSYAADNPHLGVKTILIRTGSSSYGVVEDNTSTQEVTTGSVQQYQYASNEFNCIDIDDSAGNFYEIDSVSLPFTTPIAGPFKF